MPYDLIIIGGGPAGITAGIYAARQKLKTLLITKDFGGQVARKAIDIENYPGFEPISGLDLIQTFEKHLRKFTRQNLGGQVDIEKNEVLKIQKTGAKFFVTTQSKNKFESIAVIIASGSDPRPLEVPGEKEFLGKGLSYCAVCDGALFPDKTIAVIGGGNSGFETAIFLGKIVKKIYILEAGPKIRADKTNQDIVKKTGKAEIITSAILKEIQGDKFVNSIIFQDKETGEEKTLSVEGVFVEIGSQPSTSFAKGLVDFNEKDEIRVEFESYLTKTPGLFAVGDVNIGKYKQIITACGEGAKAALAAYEYIQKQK